MAATKGRTIRVKACATSGGTYNTIVGVEQASLTRNGVTVDVTTLTDAQVVRLMAHTDAKISLSGNYEADTTGQALIRDNYENDTDLFIQYLPDGTTGHRAQYKVESYEVSGAVGGKCAFSCELSRSGAFTTV